MKICIIDRGASIPAKKYGGTERVIWGLGKSLYQLGHEVTYIVREGSSSDFAEIIPLNEKVNLDFQIPSDTDVVHLNYQPLVRVNKPYLITMHGNPPVKEALDQNMVFISKNQAERHNSNIFVHNGLDWEDYPKPDLSLNRQYVHFLGKASWKVKNVFGAIEIAKKANKPICIIGGKRWSKTNIKRGFFTLFDKNVEFCGMMNDYEKTRVMEKSQALLFPVNWHEPFGLAIIESLYSGCAVFGSKNGSLPEIIIPEVGYCGTSTSQVANALKKFSFNPEICHTYAKEKFNAMAMTQQYLSLYKKVMTGEKLNPIAPTQNPTKNSIGKFE